MSLLTHSDTLVAMLFNRQFLIFTATETGPVVMLWISYSYSSSNIKANQSHIQDTHTDVGVPHNNTSKHMLTEIFMVLKVTSRILWLLQHQCLRLRGLLLPARGGTFLSQSWLKALSTVFSKLVSNCFLFFCFLSLINNHRISVKHGKPLLVSNTEL